MTMERVRNFFTGLSRGRTPIPRRTEEDARYVVGNEFEDHVISMFDPEAFRLVHRTPTHEGTGGDFVGPMALPDLRFLHEPTGEGFWVEAKFRSGTGPKGEVEWCTPKQLSEYKRTRASTGEKVYVALGVGGTPSGPRRVFLVDLDGVRYTTLFYWRYARNALPGTVRSMEDVERAAGGGVSRSGPAASPSLARNDATVSGRGTTSRRWAARGRPAVSTSTSAYTDLPLVGSSPP